MFILTYFFAAFGAQAQNEARHWYFATAALDFVSYPPLDLGINLPGAMEGCASVSDNAGNLLMYTNGEDIWNKNHLKMANGNNLGGHVSATQSALIIKKPGSASEYYLFTVNAGTTAAFAYSIVDMSMASGLGSVTVKNNTITAPVTEKLAATPHCNGQDVWILVHEQNNNVFNSYLLTASGLNTTAVVSAVGSVHVLGPKGSIGSEGQMKISPTGKKVAVAISGLNDTFELFDFDPASGTVSNALFLGTYKLPYGCEFSPDGTKLYGTFFISDNPGISGIVQWDICSGSQQAISNSATVLDSTFGYNSFSMQLGPFNKIYISENHQYSMGTINSPNLPGVSCNVAMASVSFTGGTCQLGLPNFPGNLFREKVKVAAVAGNCSEAAFSYTLPAQCTASGTAPQSLQWFFGDPSSGNADTSFQASPTHTYPSGNGTYMAGLIAHYPCYSDTVSLQVSFSSFPDLQVDSVTTICENESVTITAKGATTYSWSTGAITPILQLSPLSTSVYTAYGYSTNGCMVSKPVKIEVEQCNGYFEQPPVSLKFFPNPVRETLKLSARGTGIAVVSDLSGRIVFSFAVKAGENVLDVSSLVPGMYLVQLSGNKGKTQTIKFVKTPG